MLVRAWCAALEPLARANTGARLFNVDGTQAVRSSGLSAQHWAGPRAWFLGAPGRRSDAEEVRTLATRAMRALLVNLRRLSSSTDREVSRYADLVRLAQWFDASDADQACALWAATFGLYPSRHLGFPAQTDGEPVPATSSWWSTPVAEVPVMLRTSGERKAAGATSRREDFSAVKAQRLRERAATEAERAGALVELKTHTGCPLVEVQVSDAARVHLLELHARALAGAGGPLISSATATAALPDGSTLVLRVSPAPGGSASVISPSGTLRVHDLTLELSCPGGDVLKYPAIPLYVSLRHTAWPAMAMGRRAGQSGAARAVRRGRGVTVRAETPPRARLRPRCSRRCRR